MEKRRKIKARLVFGERIDARMDMGLREGCRSAGEVVSEDQEDLKTEEGGEEECWTTREGQNV